MSKCKIKILLIDKRMYEVMLLSLILIFCVTYKVFWYFRVTAPRYRVLPNETDLNSPPLLSSIPEKVLPIAAAESRTRGGTSVCLNGLVAFDQ